MMPQSPTTTRGLTDHTPYQEMKRANLEAAWLEASFHDPGEDRKAHTRICMARGPGAYALITMEFWPEDAAQRAEGLEERPGFPESSTPTARTASLWTATTAPLDPARN